MKLITLLLNEYIESEDKNEVIRQLVLKQEYFHVCLYLYLSFKGVSKDEKERSFSGFRMTIVRNS